MKNAGRLAVASLFLAATPLARADGLAKPFAVLADGKPIDVEIGHASPLFVDLDGDGARDLLVGQFGQGKVRFYRNEGTDAAPRFSSFTWLQADGKDLTVPTG